MTELTTQIMPNDASPFDAPSVEKMAQASLEASEYLKAFAHEGRLMILCHLSSGEKSVTNLEQLLHSRQAAVSQQLARLRLQGIIKYRREGKTIYYSLKDARARQAVALVYNIFCTDINDKGPDTAGNADGKAM